MRVNELTTSNDRRRFGRQNLAVAAAQFAAWAVLIEAMHRVPPGAAWLALALVFVLMMQGVFSLMHDAIHGHGHPDARVNHAIGWLSGALFGTAYTLFRVNHEGHHVRNRTRAEVAEYVYPDDDRVWKTAKYYFAILGGIWLGSFLALFVLPCVPYRHVRRMNLSSNSMNGYSLSFTEYSARDWQVQRVECVGVLAFWIAAIALMDWSLATLAVVYALFAFSWSSLQWIYHLRTPLHPVEGAYNLRAPMLVRWLFLNFNYNLTHHRQPGVPWQRLHARADLRETQPLLARWIGVFRPPEPLPADPGSIRKVYF